MPEQASMDAMPCCDFKPSSGPYHFPRQLPPLIPPTEVTFGDIPCIPDVDLDNPFDWSIDCVTLAAGGDNDDNDDNDDDDGDDCEDCKVDIEPKMPGTPPNIHCEGAMMKGVRYEIEPSVVTVCTDGGGGEPVEFQVTAIYEQCDSNGNPVPGAPSMTVGPTTVVREIPVFELLRDVCSPPPPDAQTLGPCDFTPVGIPFPVVVTSPPPPCGQWVWEVISPKPPNVEVTGCDDPGDIPNWPPKYPIPSDDGGGTPGTPPGGGNRWPPPRPPGTSWPPSGDGGGDTGGGPPVVIINNPCVIPPAMVRAHWYIGQECISSYDTWVQPSIETVTPQIDFNVEHFAYPIEGRWEAIGTLTVTLPGMDPHIQTTHLKVGCSQIVTDTLYVPQYVDDIIICSYGSGAYQVVCIGEPCSPGAECSLLPNFLPPDIDLIVDCIPINDLCEYTLTPNNPPTKSKPPSLMCVDGLHEGSHYEVEIPEFKEDGTPNVVMPTCCKSGEEDGDEEEDCNDEIEIIVTAYDTNGSVMNNPPAVVTYNVNVCGALEICMEDIEIEMEPCVDVHDENDDDDNDEDDDDEDECGSCLTKTVPHPTLPGEFIQVPSSICVALKVKQPACGYYEITPSHVHLTDPSIPLPVPATIDWFNDDGVRMASVQKMVVVHCPNDGWCEWSEQEFEEDPLTGVYKFSQTLTCHDSRGNVEEHLVEMDVPPGESRTVTVEVKGVGDCVATLPINVYSTFFQHGCKPALTCEQTLQEVNLDMTPDCNSMSDEPAEETPDCDASILVTLSTRTPPLTLVCPPSEDNPSGVIKAETYRIKVKRGEGSESTLSDNQVRVPIHLNREEFDALGMTYDIAAVNADGSEICSAEGVKLSMDPYNDFVLRCNMDQMDILIGPQHGGGEDGPQPCLEIQVLMPRNLPNAGCIRVWYTTDMSRNKPYPPSDPWILSEDHCIPIDPEEHCQDFDIHVRWFVCCDDDPSNPHPGVLIAQRDARYHHCGDLGSGSDDESPPVGPDECICEVIEPIMAPKFFDKGITPNPMALGPGGTFFLPNSIDGELGFLLFMAMGRVKIPGRTHQPLRATFKGGEPYQVRVWNSDTEEWEWEERYRKMGEFRMQWDEEEEIFVPLYLMRREIMLDEACVAMRRGNDTGYPFKFKYADGTIFSSGLPTGPDSYSNLHYQSELPFWGSDDNPLGDDDAPSGALKMWHFYQMQPYYFGGSVEVSDDDTITSSFARGISPQQWKLTTDPNMAEMDYEFATGVGLAAGEVTRPGAKLTGRRKEVTFQAPHVDEYGQFTGAGTMPLTFSYYEVSGESKIKTPIEGQPKVELYRARVTELVLSNEGMGDPPRTEEEATEFTLKYLDMERFEHYVKPELIAPPDYELVEVTLKKVKTSADVTPSGKTFHSQADELVNPLAVVNDMQTDQQGHLTKRLRALFYSKQTRDEETTNEDGCTFARVPQAFRVCQLPFGYALEVASLEHYYGTDEDECAPYHIREEYNVVREEGRNTSGIIELQLSSNECFKHRLQTKVLPQVN